MSAILDALKKLEGDAESGSGPSAVHNAGGCFSRAARHIHARPGFLITGGIVLLCLFCAAVWHTAVLVTDGQSRKAGAVHTVSIPLRPENQAEPAQKDFSVKHPPSIKAEKDDESTPIKTRETEKPSVPAPGESESSTLARSGAKTRTTGTQSEPEAAAKPRSKAELLQDKSLSLQAVSWSSSPQKRFAVINGRICREGERIGDYRIRRINAEEVLVTGSGQTWRLVFDKR
ncbi:MAG: general secretion pathway protein GspB [Desulfobacteraceae bacterium]|nr:general secretion pathway protein GspB [Desulfobacteraceae bacterium]